MRTWLPLAQMRLSLAQMRLSLAQMRLSLAQMRLPLAQMRLPLAQMRLPLAQMRLPLAQMRLSLARMRLSLARMRLSLVRTRLSLVWTRLSLVWTRWTTAAGRSLLREDGPRFRLGGPTPRPYNRPMSCFLEFRTSGSPLPTIADQSMDRNVRRHCAHTMKYIALGVVSLLVPLVASAQETFSGEFQLKAKARIEGLTLAPEYHIAVEGGTATIKYSKDGTAREEKGAVTLTVQNGIDPTTGRPAKFAGSLRVEFVSPGWNRDKFVTRIELPIELTAKTRKVPSSPVPEPIPGFATTAFADVLWLDVLSNGISRYTDPMNVRMHSEYSVEVIKNPIK